MRTLAVFAAVLVLLIAPAHAAERVWTRMTGQYPIESAPVAVDMSDSGVQQLVAVNRGGQVMVWHPDGSDWGSGQDGMVAQLPEGRWTSTPAFFRSEDRTGPGTQFVFVSVEGTVVALDIHFKPLWQFTLGAETHWARATPALLDTPKGPLWCVGDVSGTVTALTLTGDRAWSTALEEGPCKADLQSFVQDNGEQMLLVPSGSALYCLNAAGKRLWTGALGGETLSRPEVVTTSKGRIIVCGAGEGSLFAFGLDGKKLWETPVGVAMDASIAVVPREGAEPLIVFTGLWGNLYAVNTEGELLWTHKFRSKTRSKPLVFDFDDDGKSEILVTAYNQHAYLFDADGNLLDDVRATGTMNASAIPLRDAGTNQTDALLIAGTLLAHRVRFGTLAPVYGPVGEPGDVAVTLPERWPDARIPRLRIDNANGALLRINMTGFDKIGNAIKRGCLTSRSIMDIEIPELLESSLNLHVTVHDARGRLVVDKAELVRGYPKHVNFEHLPGVMANSTAPYGDFDEAQPIPYHAEMWRRLRDTLSIGPLYVNELDQGACLLTYWYSESRVHITVNPPQREDGTPFGGSITLRQVVQTKSVNGEEAADALPGIGADGVVIPEVSTVKVWVSVDAHGALPGKYAGTITFKETSIPFPYEIDVVDIALPEPLPLTLCTWDYIPNQWFPDHTEAVLDDLSNHGNTVFPRSSAVPKAYVDAAGELVMDWSNLDEQLALLDGRGVILFQLGHPHIEFAAAPGETEKRVKELEYFHALRDYLKAKGWDYGDFAFYPVDEPGLDNGKRVPGFIDAAELFREADPKFQIYTDPVPGLSWADYERIAPLVDVWCPNMRLVTGLIAGDPRMRDIMQSGKTVWSYECISQVKSLSPLRYNRANAWRAAYFGLDGIGHWTYSTTSQDMWQANAEANDEYALVYPGTLPVPSVRWEAVRDGLEDVAAMKILEGRMAAHKAAGTKADIVAEAENELRIARNDVMEMSDEVYVESRDFLEQGDRMLWHTWADVDTFRRHREKIAELTLALALE